MSRSKTNRHKSRSRGFCFTINNYTDDDIAALVSLPEDSEATYMICGFETANSGTKHIQGYIQYPNQRSEDELRSFLKDYLSRAHLEVRRGTSVEAAAYCAKDCDYYEYGSRPIQGKRGDLDFIRSDLKKGVSMHEISHNYFSRWCQYRKAFSEYLEMHGPRYETEIYYYCDSDIKSMYRERPNNSRILEYLAEDCYYHKLMHIAASGRYRIIFIPYTLYKSDKDKLYGIAHPFEDYLENKMSAIRRLCRIESIDLDVSVCSDDDTVSDHTSQSEDES